eukprot:gene20953-7816_t
MFYLMPPSLRKRSSMTDFIHNPDFVFWDHADADEWTALLHLAHVSIRLVSLGAMYPLVGHAMPFHEAEDTVRELNEINMMNGANTKEFRYHH